MATNQEGPMTPGTHADLVARLREHARCLDLANEPAGATEARDISDALAALPPPSDDQTMSDAATLRGYIRTHGETPAMTWSSREHWKARAEQAEAARPADPPALVALLKEPHFKGHPRVAGFALDETTVMVDAAWYERLMALPAAPPVPLATPTHVEIDHDGDLCLDFDRANDRVVSLTLYQDGRVGYSALVGGKSAHGIVTAAEPMPSWVRDAIAAPPVTDTPQGQPFDLRVAEWLTACFGTGISGDVTERNHRFLEEALELVQTGGCTAREAHMLVDYVYGRQEGEANQEAGGVMLTLAALCMARGIDMAQAGEDELRRVWTKIDVIRKKQAEKPQHSPQPAAPTVPPQEGR